LEKTAALLGTLVEVDEATLALDELEFARLRIRVTVGCEAKLTLYMKINETMYEIYLMEGYTVPEHKLCQCQWDDHSADANDLDSQ